MFRDNFTQGLGESDRKFIIELFQDAVRVRLELPEHIPCGSFFRKTRYLAPVCHEVAHAFAQVFCGVAVDGEYLFVEGHNRDKQESVSYVLNSSMLHSWVEVVTEQGTRVILDVFPDKGQSVFPVLFLAPHPAYFVPTDEVVVRELGLLKRRNFRKRVAIVAKAMQNL